MTTITAYCQSLKSQIINKFPTRWLQIKELYQHQIKSVTTALPIICKFGSIRNYLKHLVHRFLCLRETNGSENKTAVLKFNHYSFIIWWNVTLAGPLGIPTMYVYHSMNTFVLLVVQHLRKSHNCDQWLHYNLQQPQVVQTKNYTECNQQL